MAKDNRKNTNRGLASANDETRAELQEKGVRLLMVKEAYKRRTMKQELELQEKGVKPLMVVEEERIE